MDLRPAIDIHQLLAIQNPKNPAYQFSIAAECNDLGNVHRDQGRNDEALKELLRSQDILQSLDEQYPANAEYQRELRDATNSLGQLYRQTGRIEEANKLFQDSVQRSERLIAEFPHNQHYYPRLGESYHRLGGYLEQTGRYEKAAEAYRQMQGVYEKLVEDLPKEPGYRNKLIQSQCKLVRVLKAAGRDQKAAELWRHTLTTIDEAIGRNPNDADLFIRRAKAYAYLKQWDKAIKDCGQAIKLKPNNEVAALIRSQMLLLANRTEEYQKACATMLQQFGQSGRPAVMGAAAWACLSGPNATGDPTVPLELAKRVVAMRPTWWWPQHFLGMAYFRVGQHEAATEQFNKSLELAPNWHPHLHWLGLAMIHHESGETDKARQWYDKAVDWMMQHPAQCELVFNDWLEGQIQRREVERLLKESEQKKEVAASQGKE